MGLFAALRVALDALLVNKGRSALTSLGIVIGISAVIAMVAAGAGARSKLDERLESVGKNLILIRPGGRTQSGVQADTAPLTSADAAAIRRQLGGTLLAAVAETQVIQRVAATPTHNWPTMIVGCTPDLQSARQWAVAQGRFLTEDDVKKVANVCLLGHSAKQRLFADRPNPLGQFVRIDNVQFRVVGVLAVKGRSPTGADQDDQLFVPLTTLQRKLAGNDRLTLVVASVRSENLIERAKEEITRILQEQHHLKPGAEDFDVNSVQEMAQLAVIMTSTLQVLIAVIASISLLVGGIGIMNIMLVSVTERTREIGIRLAVGASASDILVQFLLEALALAFVGGVLGILLGLLAAVAMAEIAGWPLVVSPFVVAVAFLVSAGVGVFFGYYPARKASRLDPIEALRYE
jgi:putative ABC transport system permease protein